MLQLINDRRKMKKITNMVLMLFVSVILLVMSANAVQDFTVSPSSFTQTVEQNSVSTDTFTITNTGDELINLSITKNDLEKGAQTMGLTLNDTSITNLAVGATVDIEFTYTGSDTTLGEFIGSVVVTNSDNSSQSRNVVITSTIVEENSQVNVAFDDANSRIEMELDVDDDDETATFILRNTGVLELFNIEFDLGILDGDDDEIDNDDIELNGEAGDKTLKLNDEEGSGFSLEANETYKLKVKIDIPSNLDVDNYIGDLKVSYETNDGTSYEKEFSLKVIATSDDEDIYFDDNLWVKSGVLEVTGEAGDNLDDIEIEVTNDASYDVEDLYFKLEGDLEEEDSNSKIDKEQVTFVASFDVDERDTENVDLEIDIPEDTSSGTYVTDLYLYNAAGKKQDTITLKVKVVGEVFVKDIKFDETVSPDSSLDVEVIVKNQGTKTYRNVKVYATLFDIDYGASDITESSSTFILDSNDEQEISLRFAIPEEASDGSHTLEVRVSYEDDEIVEIEELFVDRPTNNMVIVSSNINPSVAKCNNQLYTSISFKNLGKFDRDVVISSEIEGTNVKQTTSEFEVMTDERAQESINLNIGALEAGEYNVIQKISFAGTFKKVETPLIIRECNEGGSDLNLDIKDLNETEDNQTYTGNTYDIFGTPVDRLTVYLGGGVGLIFIAIIIVAIFLL